MCRFNLHIFDLFLDSRLARVDSMNNRGIEFEFASVGHKTVHLLLNVVKLCVAEAEYVWVVKKHVGKSLVTCYEFFLGLGRVSVAPCVPCFTIVIQESIAPADSAVLAYE